MKIVPLLLLCLIAGCTNASTTKKEIVFPDMKSAQAEVDNVVDSDPQAIPANGVLVKSCTAEIWSFSFGTFDSKDLQACDAGSHMTGVNNAQVFDALRELLNKYP